MLKIKVLLLEIILLPPHTETNSSSSLDFEMLDSLAPYYQAGLGNRLCYEITFNDYNQVINSSVASPDAKYKITDVSLEYEIVTQPDLARSTKLWSCCMTEFSGIDKFQ